MPRSVKHGGKKSRRYTKSKNVATARKKAVKKKKTKFSCKEIASEWNKDKSIKQNLEAMGLVYDVNKAIGLLPDSSTSMDVEEMDVSEAAKLGSISQQKKKAERKPKGSSEKAERVIRTLEKAAADDEARMRKGRKFRLLQKDIDFCVHMMKRHGEDYEAMSRDSKNIYQNTPQQIQRKLRIFKQTPEFGAKFNIV